jgi:hypothetical protein
MATTPPTAGRLTDLPVWRLIVALADAERTCGPSSSTVRTLARALEERLRRDPRTPEEVRHGD